MMKKNKERQEEFLKLNQQEKLDYLNKIVKDEGTANIDKQCGFSYSWVSDKLSEEGIFYVSKIRKFIIDASINISEEDGNSLTSEEIAFIKKLYKENKIVQNDIRLVVGTCQMPMNRTIPLDKEINKEWNDFTKNLKGIAIKDLYSSALKEFIDKYKSNV